MVKKVEEDATSRIIAEVSVLSIQKQRVLQALLTEKTVAAAAKKLKLSADTVYYYLRDEEFKAALHEIQAAMFAEVTNRLTVDATAMLDKLATLADTARSEAVRKSAMDSWLANFLKVREAGEVEERLAEVERLLAEGSRGRGSQR